MARAGMEMVVAAGAATARAAMARAGMEMVVAAGAVAARARVSVACRVYSAAPCRVDRATEAAACTVEGRSHNSRCRKCNRRTPLRLRRHRSCRRRWRDMRCTCPRKSPAGVMSAAAAAAAMARAELEMVVAAGAATALARVTVETVPFRVDKEAARAEVERLVAGWWQKICAPLPG